jgi:alanine racemase
VAVLFGPGDDGQPTATDWADAIGTINYEIVTRFGSPRVRRVYDGTAGVPEANAAAGDAAEDEA